MQVIDGKIFDAVKGSSLKEANCVRKIVSIFLSSHKQDVFKTKARFILAANADAISILTSQIICVS